MSHPNTDRDEHVRQIRERQKWRANASRQNGRTPESTFRFLQRQTIVALRRTVQ